ncbi:MAG: hypothetical protein L0229_21240 [Blastocatellia bacterium]|nr:hypothetical protein [Blastocatellia bacterium]
MRAKLVVMVMTVFAAAALGFQFSANAAYAPEGERLSDAGTESSMAQRRRRKPMSAMKGVPKGVDKCLEHLIEMASEDPFPAYEGHPEEIVNNGLMWNDPKSKCSIGDNHDLKLKIIEMSKEWRMKNAERVRSLLEEIKNAAA